MLTSVIAILMLLMGASGLGQLSNRRTEDCLPLCIAGTAVWLFGFYCAGMVSLGLLSLCVGAVLLFAAGWMKNKQLSVSPAIAVYLGMCLVYLVFLRGNQVLRHDELRLWGAVPKLLHETGKLQLGRTSPLFIQMQPYTPGLPLLGYFFTAFQREFQDNALFVCYAAVVMAFLLPSLSGWQWKRGGFLIPAGALLFLTPCVFTSHVCDGAMFAMSLYVDALLGAVAGYCFYLAGNRPFRSWWDTGSFGLSLGFLCLLKSTGLVFAIIALICAMIVSWRENKRRLFVPAALIAFSSGLWKLTLVLHGVREESRLQMHSLTKGVVRNVLGALASEHVVLAKVPLGFLLSFLFAFPVLLALYWVVFRLRKKQSFRDAAVLFVGFLVSTVIFLYGYAMMYGENLESFARYMTTPLLAIFTCILLSGIPLLREAPAQDWLRNKLRPGLLMGLRIGCTCFAVLIFAAWCFIAPRGGEWGETDAQAQRIRTLVEQSLEPEEQGWVFLVIAGDGWANSHIHHRIFYDLLSENVNIRNGAAETQVVEPGLENPTAVWAETLKNGSNFVYLYSIEDAFLPVFAELSEDTAEAGTLYRVLPSDSTYGVTLKKQ